MLAFAIRKVLHDTSFVLQLNDNQENFKQLKIYDSFTSE